jgi:hypothetical protein
MKLQLQNNLKDLLARVFCSCGGWKKKTMNKKKQTRDSEKEKNKRERM